MPMKQTGRKVYKTMQGKTVDMDLLRQRNELTPAVGNAKVNARGDELGAGGKIIKRREELMQDYYVKNGSTPDEIAVKKTNAVEKDLTDDWVEPTNTVKAKKTTVKKEDPVDMMGADEWVEDEDGNFVQKGE